MKGIIMDYKKLAIGIGLGVVSMVTSAMGATKIREGLGQVQVTLKNLKPEDIINLDKMAGMKK
jgi:hypothetical protein